MRNILAQAVTLLAILIVIAVFANLPEIQREIRMHTM